MEIPILYGEKEYFVDPMTLVIKPLGTIVHCNEVAPVRYEIQGKWYCSYPQLRECPEPEHIPITDVNIDDVDLATMGLGKSIYSQKQLEDFASFQEAANTREAYVAEQAEIAHGSMSSSGEWGMGLNQWAQSQLIDLVGNYFVPFYKFLGPPTVTLIVILMAIGTVKLCISVVLRAVTILRAKGCGIWILAALWSTLFQVLMMPIRWATGAADDVAARVGDHMLKEATKEGVHYPLKEAAILKQHSDVESGHVWLTRQHSGHQYSVIEKESE
jgi:hypothetical protein